MRSVVQNRKTTCFGIEKLLGFLHFHDKRCPLVSSSRTWRNHSPCCSPSRRHCDVIVHDVGQMPDLSTSPVSPNMQNPNVSVYLKPWRECRCCNKYYLMNLQSILHLILTHLLEGSIQTIHNCRWRPVI